MARRQAGQIIADSLPPVILTVPERQIKMLYRYIQAMNGCLLFYIICWTLLGVANFFAIRQIWMRTANDTEVVLSLFSF